MTMLRTIMSVTVAACITGCATARPAQPSFFCMADAEGPCETPTQAQIEPLLYAVLDRVLAGNDYLPDRNLLPAFTALSHPRGGRAVATQGDACVGFGSAGLRSEV
ncbi:MAG: hypothetical protein HY901_09870 [Deltaproteobacteria bacterium]|nr:hypothetical protein [Deltaproteobacteria bacterium]